MRVVIPLYDRFTALDAVGPYEVLRLVPGAEVTFVADRPGPIQADSPALAMVATATYADVTDCDVLVVPGGIGTHDRLTDRPLLDFLVGMANTARWTTSVCTGSLLLGAAGLLAGRRATTHWARASLLARYGATHTPGRVVIDGNVVTAAGVSAGIDMALSLAERLTDRLTAEAIQLAIEYDPQPPFATGCAATAPQRVKDRVTAGLG
jgi:transcriptional regulator GlxA family with amidase domain